MKYLVILGVVLGIFVLIGCQQEMRRKTTRDTIIRTLQSPQSSELSTADSIYVKKVSRNQDSISFYRKQEFLGSATIVYE